MKAHGSIKAIVGLAAVGCLACTANATVICNAPGVHTLNTEVRDNVQVANPGAVVNVDWGGVVRYIGPTTRDPAVSVSSGVLNVQNNGQIVSVQGRTAIDMQGGGTSSLVKLHDRAMVVGDIVQRGVVQGWQQESTATKRLYLEGNSVVYGNVAYTGYMRMEDQARINGDIGALPDIGHLNFDMRGGMVTGVLDLVGYGESIVNISGGMLLGGVRGSFGSVDFDMTGGYIDRGLRTGAAVSGYFHDARIDGGMQFWNGTPGGASSLVFTGTGQYNANAGDYLFSMVGNRFSQEALTSRVDIRGGQWGYEEQGLGFFLDEWATLHIHGTDLAFNNGWLSGYLLDGSWFNSQITFGTNWRGAFNIFNVNANVPEPGTLGLLATCMFGMLLAGRRRRA